MTSNNRDPNWYLAQLKPNSVNTALRNLARQGFATFLPLERYTRRQGGRFSTFKRPYFPGYLFVGIEEQSAPWRAIRSTQGIARLLCIGNEPARVPQIIVSELRRNCDTDGCITRFSGLAGGDSVEIGQGPFAGFLGQIDQIDPEKRAWVLIDIMGKSTKVSVQTSHLRLAS